jgi:hypothetical protein
MHEHRIWGAQVEKAGVTRDAAGAVEAVTLLVTARGGPGDDCPRRALDGVAVQIRRDGGTPIEKSISAGFLSITVAEVERADTGGRLGQYVLSSERFADGAPLFQLPELDERLAGPTPEGPGVPQLDDPRLQPLKERAAELGIEDWGRFCRHIVLMHKGACEALDDGTDRARCTRMQEEALGKSWIFVVQNVRRAIRYDEQRDEFEVDVSGMLDGAFDIEDCAAQGCGGLMVSTRPFNTPDTGADFETWEQRHLTALEQAFRPVHTFKVAGTALSSREAFESDLAVDVLVQIVDRQTSIVGDWFDFRNVQVRIVGMQAYTRDLSWGAMLDAPTQDVRLFRCGTGSILEGDPGRLSSGPASLPVCVATSRND